MSSLFNDGPANDGPPPATVPPVVWRSDHGFVRALLRVRLPNANA